MGFAIIGMVVTAAILRIISCIRSGPVEQLAPTAHTPRLSRTIAADAASLPKSVLPSASNVSDTITGISVVSFAAITAARHSCRLIMVSTTSRSTPACTSAVICSLYTSTSSSKSRSPIGESCLPVIVRSPAISALPSTASAVR